MPPYYKMKETDPQSKHEYKFVNMPKYEGKKLVEIGVAKEVTLNPNPLIYSDEGGPIETNGYDKDFSKQWLEDL